MGDLAKEGGVGIATHHLTRREGSWAHQSTDDIFEPRSQFFKVTCAPAAGTV